MLVRFAREYGDAVTIRAGSQTIFLVSDPESVRDVLTKDHRNFTKGRALGLAKRTLGEGLLTSDGEPYLRYRRLAQPAFHGKSSPELSAPVQVFLERLHARWEDGADLDIRKEMTELCLNISAKIFLGVDLSSQAEDLGNVFHSVLSILNYLNLLPDFVQHLPIPINVRLKKLCDELDAAANQIVELRRTSRSTSEDLLSALLSHQGDTSDPALTEKQIREQVITLLFAGFEAPCHALSWTWYLISRHPKVEERLHHELDDVLGGRKPTAEDLPSLPLTRGVISEALRLYPPVWVIARRIVAPYQLKQFTLPAGAELFMSPYVVHRDPRNFPDPLTFDPDRWAPAVEQHRPKFSFIPFGGGSRGCMGERFAWLELMLSLASIAQRWELRLKDQREIMPNPAFTFGPRSRIQVMLRRRR